MSQNEEVLIPAPAWWTKAVVYQIYPRSFADSNGDGIGDLGGIRAHLDHLQQLGVDVVWLSPIYRSPQADNGYDISDYQDIDPLFGTLDEFDLLLAEMHERGIKLVMDLVVNHTSDEHAWFVEAKRGPDSPKRDWYVWRDGTARPALADGTPAPVEPNLWRSAFSGPAWTKPAGDDQYYLHLFAAKQPDLNWENPDVRDAVFDMMNWWLDRGVDGFRMDVINHIAKIQQDLRGDSTGFQMGPQIHDYLQEMNRRVFAGRDADLITVGEMPGVTVDDARLFTGVDRLELDMVFQFEHVGLDHGPASKFDNVELDLRDLKRSLSRWQTGLADQGWNSLYLGNHDQPRSLSRFGDDGQADDDRADDGQADDDRYRYESATLLATILHLHRGTPYVYQGDEIGMTNAGFQRIDQYQDIETLNWFAEQKASGRDEADLLEILRFRSRDNARTPVQWTPGAQAGFTEGTPWLEVNPNHDTINVETDRSRGDSSVFEYYRRLIALRHESPLVALGEFALLEPEHPTLYAFTRSDDDGRLLVAGNFSGSELEAPLLLEGPWGAGSLLIGNYAEAGAAAVLRPWEVRVVLA
ncbi:oligo-1,6-glucosidase [Frondihabitans sucicola]|uniref:Oligo-1,6-glucosidase n=1 Tax=Frondihabitans sucicola TaxID=1268041 RepID=A0ABN6Y9M5_9MICO|nr:alpha-glucosidase [Frondihabitans sucicola]BDZ47764.1 oligo-1,6-glucosidase [Frondihabitans sucicola]BDZ52238.1 oligo-1,6-glucosidase [Frondihabitans sucicola]